MSEKIELGDRVRDKISGMKGIVVGICDWLYSCQRVVVQPEGSKDGKAFENFNADVPQVEVIKKRVVLPPQRIIEKKDKTGGPHDAPQRHIDPTR
jgi:hypothetical protein